MNDDAPPEPTELGAPPLPATQPAQAPRPTFVFLGVVSAVSLLADIGSKAWAQIALSDRLQSNPSIVLIPNHLAFTYAENPGGAWGILTGTSEAVRRPFFLAVSVLAILFIVSLYGKLSPRQRALKWGLPLVLGGALGNLSDRITRSKVIDFIDYKAQWVDTMNRAIAGAHKGWGVTDHWPTFNVADIAICVGVALMGVDMITSRRGSTSAPRPPAPPAVLASSGGSVPPAAE